MGPESVDRLHSQLIPKQKDEQADQVRQDGAPGRGRFPISGRRQRFFEARKTRGRLRVQGDLCQDWLIALGQFQGASQDSGYAAHTQNVGQVCLQLLTRGLDPVRRSRWIG